MKKPILLTVSHTPETMKTVIRNLSREYGDRFQVLQVTSGEIASETLKQLKLSGQLLAMVLADQQLLQMSGAEFFEQAVELFPRTRRVLLTAEGDFDMAVMRPSKTAKRDYYLLNPDSLVEEHLYPLLNDLLEKWQQLTLATFEGIRVIGHRWSPLCFQLRDFLARNHVPYQWLDIESDEEARCLVKCADCDLIRLPLVLFADGSYLVKPTKTQVAEKIGLQQHATKPFYDLIVIGGGPAGLAAAVYGGSEGLRTVLIERDAPGGLAGTSPRIENYLGFPIGLSGDDLVKRSLAQARRFGVEILAPQAVADIRVEDPYRYVTLTNGQELGCYAMVVATGVYHRRLDVPGIDELQGAGVYYGVAKHALACRDEDIFIVGAGNSAGEGALHFAECARSVNILVRGSSLAKSMASYLVERIENTENIKVWLNSSIVEAKGTDKLEALTIDHSLSGEMQTVPASVLFILIGMGPCSECFTSLLAHNEQGFVLSGADLMRNGQLSQHWKLKRDPFLLETSVPGIFVAGDIRQGSIKRVASAVGEGSAAVQFVHQYLSQV